MAKPVERNWFVPNDLPARLQQGVYEPVDREEAIQAFAECETLCERLGGNVVVTTQTIPVDGVYTTVGYAFRWTAFANAKPRQVEEDPEPELVEA